MSQVNNIVTHKPSAAEPTTNRPVVAPAVDIYENAREYLVLADLPGVAHDGVQIHFEGGELSLAASRPDDKASDYLGSEIVDADYRRVFRIPETVDSDKIEARLVDGVLHLVLPKTGKAGPRQITVKMH
ncbi:MAG: Hsp20/alpha crystallin family protein [Nannocystis sp.]|uniref:Hsp20/alpha crystallin family protein n=1 Tax=Nannocystis sp. TaxID=1962667 RepID=UPI0024299C3A|nr:Hsp20/alpha crystallin family protein [Nannocystis sp.]MBK9756864.1 Hsp20/alpha crystallin family protein [Nannocystis sp.]